MFNSRILMMRSFFKRIHPFSSGQRFHCDFAPVISPDQCTEPPVRVRPISQCSFSAFVQCFFGHLIDSVASVMHAPVAFLRKLAVPLVIKTPLVSILSDFVEFWRIVTCDGLFVKNDEYSICHAQRDEWRTWPIFQSVQWQNWFVIRQWRMNFNSTELVFAQQCEDILGW